MKVLQVYNAYQKTSGEDTVVEAEKMLLESKGHDVFQYLKRNEEIEHFSNLQKVSFALSLRGSKKTEAEFRALLNEINPDICHVHNVFSIITPIIFKICKAHNIPVVHTLHNYRLLCTNTLFYRNGHVCEVCIGKSLYNSIKYKCFRNSYLMTAIMADAIQHHRKINTWDKFIDAYICLTPFAKEKYIQGGLPESMFYVKPNFVHPVTNEVVYDDFILFAGRLEPAKGIDDLIEIAKNNPEQKFVAIGHCENPEIVSGLPNLEYLGQQDKSKVMEYMKRCKCLLFPSRWYEGMPMVILEAFAHQKLVIARNMGAMSGIIKHQQNGLLFNNLAELQDCIDKINQNNNLCIELGQQAYKDYMDNYSPEINYRILNSIYQAVIQKNATKL